jgi:hypothetical protein
LANELHQVDPDNPGAVRGTEYSACLSPTTAVKTDRANPNVPRLEMSALLALSETPGRHSSSGGVVR